MDGDRDDDDCPNCGGTGFVYDCIDGFCADAESGCDLCERRCDWCSPRQAAPARGPHQWVASTLGHGEQMCARCGGTNRELAALGEMDHCSNAPVLP